jgi:CRISPR-associated exonuclease Cas4
VADVVEIRREGTTTRPFPIEYKKGRPKRHRADEVQLCAQALCLEEMLLTGVPRGALYYGKPRRRTDVFFDDGLRELTRTAANRFREIVATRTTPAARFGPKCRDCSLLDLCRPRAADRSAVRYLTGLARWGDYR